MHFIHRGLLYLKKNLGKNLALFFVLFLLGNMIIGAVALRISNYNLENSIKKRTNISAQINSHIEKREESKHVELTTDILEKIGLHDTVKKFEYNIRFELQSTELERAKESMSTINGTPFFTAKGISTTELLAIEKGEIQLIDGRLHTESELNDGAALIVISDEMAQVNTLKVGDKILLFSKVYDFTDPTIIVENSVALAEKQMDFEIIGIYPPKSTQANDPMRISSKIVGQLEELNNMIYLPNKITEEFHRFYYNIAAPLYPEELNMATIFYQTDYLLESFDSLNDFESHAMNYLPDGYYVSSNMNEFADMILPLSQLALIANIILTGSVFFAVVTIGLLLFLFLRDRKREFGIYIALGESKLYVCLQILVEVAIIASFALLLSSITGNMLAEKLSTKIIENQLLQQVEQDTFDDESIVDYSYLSDYKITISVQTYVIYIALSFVIIISTILPMYYVLRLNPKKILIE